MSDKVLEYMEGANPEALYPSDMKEAIVGIMHRFGMEPLIILDRTKCIQLLVDNSDGMSWEDAEEFFEFNTIGSWMGEGTPAFITFEKDLP